MKPVARFAGPYDFVRFPTSSRDAQPIGRRSRVSRVQGLVITPLEILDRVMPAWYCRCCLCWKRRLKKRPDASIPSRWRSTLMPCAAMVGWRPVDPDTDRRLPRGSARCRRRPILHSTICRPVRCRGSRAYYAPKGLRRPEYRTPSRRCRVFAVGAITLLRASPTIRPSSSQSSACSAPTATPWPRPRTTVARSAGSTAAISASIS